MDLLLHTPKVNNDLSRYYERAFKSAVELFIVAAYLTDWDAALELSGGCRNFRVIVGRDFGITRKAACKKVMQWLPPKRKAQFMVADRIGGFHPKAVFWREEKGGCFAIVGSSNLTEAAFKTNYEANVFSELSEVEYLKAKNWVKQIEKFSVVMSEDWLRNYNEASVGSNEPKRRGNEERITPLVLLDLPRPHGMKKRLESRRSNLVAYKKHQADLTNLFRQCASAQISSEEFYQKLPGYWGSEAGDRLQGRGWEIKGKHADFRALSHSFVNIIDAVKEDRDDVVSEEIDRLSDLDVPARGAFLSEMLCLRFPREYPVLNQPVQNYLKAVKYEAPRGASEGARFIFLSQTLRSSLLNNPGHPAKNLAELDTIIWLAYGRR